MAKDFKSLLRSISQQMERSEIEVIVGFAHLPGELKNQSAACVLDRLTENGKFSARNLEVLMDAMTEIGRNDLYKEVNTLKKKSRKKLSEDNSNSANNYFNFDIAEIEATKLRNTLQLMEGSEAIASVKRIEEVYLEAKEKADNLLRVIRHANCLTRTLLPATVTAQTESRSPPPTLTSSTDSTDHPKQSPPVSGFRELLSRKKSKSVKVKKEKGKQKEATGSQSASTEGTATAPLDMQRKLKRAQTEKTINSTKSFLRSRFPAVTNPDSESEDSLDYQLPDFSHQKREAVNHIPSMPRQVPKRLQSSNSGHQLNVSPRDNFPLSHRTSQVKGTMVRGVVPPPPMGPPPPNEPSDSEDDLDYDEAITMFEMQNSEKRPLSLESEGSKSQLPRSDASSTCTTPGSEVGSTPPATLPKPKTNRNSPDITPAIPIRRSSLNSTSSSRHSYSQQSSLQSGSESTPSQHMVDIQQQAIRLRQTAGSPHSSTGSRISPHPVSLAKALERSSNQSVNSDCNDSCSCTGDSGFDEYPPSSMPMSTSWHKSGPPTKPKPTKPLKQNSDPQLSYVNVGIISPTSPPPQPHTTISTLAPTYTTHTSTTPSPPTPSHTSVSPMGPMYNCISIEEQEPEFDDDVCPDYINVKKYVCPA